MCATVPAPVVARDSVAAVNRPAPSYPYVFAEEAPLGPDQDPARTRPARDTVLVSVWTPAGVDHVCLVTRPEWSRSGTVIDAALPGYATEASSPVVVFQVGSATTVPATATDSTRPAAS
jgi:hypothetical protein